MKAALALVALAGIVRIAEAQPKPQPPSAETVLANVEATYKKAPGLTAAFTQTVTNAMTGKVSKPKPGTLLVGKPNKIRFDYAGSNKTMMYDGKDFYSIEPDALVIRHAKTTGANPVPAAVTFITGAGSLATDFNVTFPETKDLVPGATILALTPKKPNAAYAKLLLTVNPATWQVTRTHVIDSSGNTNTIELTNVKLEAPKPDQFHFVRSKYPAVWSVEELK
ncbi:MAG: outer membrane lipoprotein carrier protein LolA [Kofleriaceae bacterium]